jgi:pimeloyl-ACP methyl ester carboxylesterase
VLCLRIPVNKNNNTPTKEKYYLAVAIAKSANVNTEQPLLYLHGGPGIATLGNLPNYLTSATWKLLREKHDLIFFDYRGTGFSEPGLCMDMEDSLSAFSKKHPSSKEIEEYEISLYKKCRESLHREGTNLATFTSFQSAADAEEIRKALQIKEWSIYGVSHGTTVALNLMGSFSKAIKNVILDSPYPPNSPWPDFIRPFEVSFQVLEKNIWEDSVAVSTFPFLRRDFVNAVNRLNANPAVLSYEENNIVTEYAYTGNDFAWSIWDALLKPRAIPYVPLAIHEVGNGNDSILQQWSTAFSTSGSYGKFSEPQSNAILCYECRPQREKDSDQSLILRYPDFASFAVYETKLCNVWRPEIPDKKTFEPVVSDVPVLILCGEYDPVCPPVMGELTAKTLSNSTLIVVPSASHAAIHADDCLRTLANRFISNPTKKIVPECVHERGKIKFVTNGLSKALSQGH